MHYHSTNQLFHGIPNRKATYITIHTELNFGRVELRIRTYILSPQYNNNNTSKNVHLYLLPWCWYQETICKRENITLKQNI